jgi:hypothetical protein
MLDAATCCQTQLAQRPIVTFRALYDVLDLIQANARTAEPPVLQAEYPVPNTPGGTHATQDSKDRQQAAAFVPADSATALDEPTCPGTGSSDQADCAAAASARSGISHKGGAR